MLRLILCAMTAVLLACPGHGGARAAQADGRCVYGPELARHSADTTLILCDGIVIESGSIAFAQRSWGTMALFAGKPSGNDMAITRVTLRDGVQRTASGTCRRVLRDDGRLDAVRCLAKAGTRWIAANFVASRI